MEKPIPADLRPRPQGPSVHMWSVLTHKCLATANHVQMSENAHTNCLFCRINRDIYLLYIYRIECVLYASEVLMSGVT